MIISIAGDPGSGKTSVARLLSGRLGWPWYSMGDLRGKMALERGLTIDELNQLGETDPATDTAVDDYARRLGETDNNFVIEGRLAWHFIPHSFKVFLSCEHKEAGRRVYGAKKRDPSRRDEPAYSSPEEAEREIKKRIESDARRYLKHYGVVFNDQKNFDLVIDTTAHKKPEQTVEKILAALKTRRKV
ncbi:hypothetical protein EPN90_01745 [Patescibacteria group bacterium]|nr:MAG: hypothetical protein EPN90_01745 [Patescibacteria group bacterium]